MTKINKSKIVGLTKEKKVVLKSYMGKCSSLIDLNKIRDEYKNGKN